jgi:hypothetical protein
VREPLDPTGVDACRTRDLLDGCASADPGLNLLGRQHRWNLDIDLIGHGCSAVTAQRGAETVVWTKNELLARVGRLTDDALAIDV